jgi:hypothetical protein
MKQLLELVESIYKSKVKFDEKCAEAHLPRETMEQHMYTFLNQKYGLKNLIIEHATALLRAVNKYSSSSSDVALFGKILRNEIDEEFRFVQAQLKQTVVELLRVYLKGTHPLKTDKALSELVARKTRGFVVKEEWIDIIKYMYNRQDSLTRIVAIREAIKAHPEAPPPPGSDGQGQGKGGKDSRRRGARSAMDADTVIAKGVIRFDRFMKIMLDFQLTEHERFCAPFRDVFRRMDTDNNGVLDEREFRDLVMTLAPTKPAKQLDELLAAIDPWENQHITFSECVTHLAPDIVALLHPQHAQG